LTSALSWADLDVAVAMRASALSMRAFRSASDLARDLSSVTVLPPNCRPAGAHRFRHAQCSMRAVSNVSLLHEAPLEVLRQEPRAVLALLQMAGRAERSSRRFVVEVLDSELSEATPSIRRADHVVLLRDTKGNARRGVAVEVQRERDDEKLSSWPLYVAYLHARHRVPVTLVVLTFDDNVAAWARKARRLGPNMLFAPSVVGPAELPEILSVEDAKAHREQSMLTALARLGAQDGATADAYDEQVARVFEAMLRSEASDLSRTYLSLLHGTSRGGLRSRLEQLFKEKYGMGAMEMIFEDGKAEGKAEGRAEGEALALLKVLRARGLSIGAAVESRIRETRDLALLDRALAARSVEEVLAD
jgi:hypothetical protein